MSWATLDPAVRTVAENTLTRSQLEAWKLELAGMGHRRIALHLDLAPSTVKDRLDAAYRNLRRAGITQDASGRYHQDTAA